LQTEASNLATVPAVAERDEGVIVFDVETTGTDRRRDQVIELCVQYGLDHDGGGPPPGAARVASRIWRFRPSVPIHPGAQAVHGISAAELEDCPPFAACADEVLAVFAEAQVIVGYNLAFDIDMLQAEYERLARPPLDLTGKTIVDAFRLWQQFEPRSLQHAHQRFVGDSFAAAHSARADVAATGRVLRGMMRWFGLADRDWGEVAKACDPDGRLRGASRSSWVGPSKHLQWSEDGHIVMTFGKHAGLPILAVARSDAGYLRWVIEKDFPPHVGEVCKRALDLARSPADARADAELVAWARQRYGQPAPTVEPAFAAAAD
jgi:DNA polymerase III subunit epsilon